jgi:hypothetical protein
MEIRNPVQWGADSVTLAAVALRSVFSNAGVDLNISQPQVRRITLSDLKDVLITWHLYRKVVP